MAAPLIDDIQTRSIDIPLNEPFGIAGGAQDVARNEFVEVRLDDGTVGLGEAAPFPAFNGETRDDALAAIEIARPLLVGARTGWRDVARTLRDAIPVAPSARCALETAVLDAVTKRSGLSLWSFFGGVEPALTTDITIVTGTTERAASAATDAAAKGFETLKVKVGGQSVAEDVERLEAIATAARGTRLVLDGNASFRAPDAIELVGALRARGIAVALFEQPTPTDDLRALREVRERARVAVAADESAASAEDVARIARDTAADVVNVKIAKSGVAEAVDMVATARAHGLGLMIGGLVESPLAMTVSACLAAGIGGFSFVDLDTPLFMTTTPTRGGWTQRGPRIEVDLLGPGHGVTLA